MIAERWIAHGNPWNVPRATLAFLNGILNATFIFTSTFGVSARQILMVEKIILEVSCLKKIWHRNYCVINSDA